MEYQTGTIVLAVLCFGLVFAFPSEHQIQSRLHKSTSVQICGSRLATEISLVCKGQYNTLIPRTTPPMPFIDPQEAKTMFRRHRRRRHGVIDECCNKPCTYDELRSFCRD